jgi:outer membrane biosynthesis protein TonB
VALSDDQKAMLRLLAQREQGYDDIAALMGLSVEEVRAKVKDALAELDQAAAEEKVAEKAPEPPPPPPPPPAPEPTPPTPPPPKPASEPLAKPPASTAKKAPSRPRPKLPEDRGALRALTAGGAVVLVIVLLLVTGVLGGDDGGSDTTTATTTGSETGAAAETGTPTANGKKPTEALLKAVDGSNATGQALFGRSGQNVVLLLSAKGLQPSPKGQSYTVSLVRSPTQRLPLVAAKAGDNGVISGRFQVAAQVLGLLAGGFDEMEVSLVADDTLKAALAEARNAKKAPDYGGTAVLAGPVTGPIVEAGGEG